MARSKCFIIYQPDKTRTDAPEYDKDRYNLLGEIARCGRNDFMVRFEVYKSKDSDDKGYYCRGVTDDTRLTQTQESDNVDEMKDLANRAVSQCFSEKNAPIDENLVAELRRDLRKKLFAWLRDLKPDGDFRLDFDEMPKIDIRQSSGDLIILKIGSAITSAQNAPLLLKVSLCNDEGQRSFSFRVQFYFEDSKDAKQSVKLEEDKNKQMVTITCVNFNNSLETGIKTTRVAEYLKKDIFFQFWVYALGGGIAKKVDYCFYQKEGQA